MGKDNSLVMRSTPLSEEEAKQIMVEEAAKRLKEWRHEQVRIVGGPGISELILAILEPRIENGQLRTLRFHLVRGGLDVTIPCGFRKMNNLDSQPDQPKSIQLVGVLSEKHLYMFDGIYNFHSRNGYLTIPENTA